MKVGDKLLCKVGYNDDFIKGKLYEIYDIYDDNHIIICGENENKYTYIDDSFIFYLDGCKNKFANSLGLYNYFYTDKELRKMKLNKLSGSPL